MPVPYPYPPPLNPTLPSPNPESPITTCENCRARILAGSSRRTWEKSSVMSGCLSAVAVMISARLMACEGRALSSPSTQALCFGVRGDGGLGG